METRFIGSNLKENFVIISDNPSDRWMLSALLRLFRNKVIPALDHCAKKLSIPQTPVYSIAIAIERKKYEAQYVSNVLY
jgi:hypothetical protein